ncbi:alpha/beta fold hydrolase [Pelagibius sp.]|uniref:alpha/beta fold hydrolase n=1 Tax=Pelagibius sp. TaxID=1931238 RepID=UPI00261D0A7E|nr:alpha/beta fold hydrolase [Pelagibius sp.]
MIYGFGSYRLDTDRLELWQGEKVVAVEPQVFHLLQHLVENRERVVSKDELIEQVWDGRIVSDATLSSRINAARRAVGDSGAKQAVIRTAVRRGFRFVAEVTEGAGCGAGQVQDSQAAEGPPAALSGGPDVPISAPEVPQTIVGERKQVTALVAGLRGAGELFGALDPEAALVEIDPALKAMSQAVARYGGAVSAVVDDGMLALFGAPQAQEDHAVRACYAALAMRSAVQRLGSDRLQPAIGLHSGEAVVRTSAEGAARSYEAMGPAVQIARRLQERAGPAEIALTAATRERARGYFQTTAGGKLELAAENSTTVYRLTAPSQARTPWQARAGRSLAQFVGREHESAQLGRALQRAGLGSGEVIAVVAEPGVGKSRLLHEFLATPAATDWTLLETGAVSYGASESYGPVAALLRSWLSVDPQDSQTAAAEKVRSAVLGLDRGLAATLPALLSVLDLPVDDRAWLALSPPLRRRHILDALKAVFVRESQHRPLVLALEDLHWFDAESLAFVDGLIDGLGAARMLLVVTFRPEFKHAWAARSSYSEIRLRPLQDESASRLLDDLLGTDPGLSEVKRLLIERTQGTPLFLEETAQELAETDALVGQRGAYRLAAPVESFEIPATVQSVLAARIDRLAPPSKYLLQVAAVIGPSIAADVLEQAAELPPGQLSETLAALQAGDFLFESQLFPERVYTFKHDLTRDVAYRGLLRADRAGLHRRVAEILERLYAGRVAEAVESIAGHFAAGEAWREATTYFLMAAERAKERYSYKQAAGIARKALEAAAAGGLAEQTSQSHVLLGDLESLLGDLDAANHHYDAAIEAESDDTRRQVVANKRHHRDFVIRGEARLAYYEQGSGDQTLLLIHPFIYGLHVFQLIVEQLCQRFRIITIDGRGTGASDPLPPGYTLDDHVEDFAAVIQAVKRGQRTTAVGMSRGVNLLAKLSVSRPELLDRLVLVGGGMRQTVGLGVVPAEGRGAEGRQPTPFDQALEAGDFARAVRIFSRTIYSEDGTGDLRLQFEEQCLKLPRETLVNFFTFDPSVDIANVIGRISRPTLVMHGTVDEDVPLEEGIAIADAIPDAQFYAFEGKGHLPTFTATHEFCDRVLRFVEETPV